MVRNDYLNDQKKEIAARVFEIIKPFARTTFVFGGFAAHLNGSPRDINDADFLVDFAHPDISFDDGGRGEQILNYLSMKFKKEFGDDFKGFKKVDDSTVTTECMGLEIDIACRPSLIKNRDIDKYERIEINDTKLRVETPLDCVHGKALGFIFRKDIVKKLTDLYDMINMISRHDDLSDWNTKLNTNKGEAYKVKINNLKKNGEVVIKKDSLEEEFFSSLKEFTNSLNKSETVKIIKDKFGEDKVKDVIKLIKEFSNSLTKAKTKASALNL